MGISPVTARSMVLRGLADPAEADLFWHGGAQAMHDPLDSDRGLASLPAAVDRIRDAIKADQKITVYGDYDVDGVSATALMVEVLRSLGAAVDHYIPGRLDEGYGLNAAALEEIRGRGTQLVVTVDCGVSAVDEARRARELGLDLVVTDHHRPGDTLPDCAAVVNPRRVDCPYPFKDLAGVGVAYKVAQALLARVSGREGEPLSAAPAACATGPGAAPVAATYLDLVALGTIGDVVPLLGENRHLVKRGLELLARAPRPGIAALCAVSGFDTARGGGLESSQVAFGLAPRLNAAGRMGSAQTALDLLLSRRKGEAAALASQLDAWNRERQSTEQRILTEALALTGAPEAYDKPAVVLASQGWHPGVIGIVASKLTELFHRPVFLIALEGEEGRGSARSVPWCDLYGTLAGASDLLVRFGGHHQAAGFTVLERHLGEFTSRVEEACAAAAAKEGASPGQGTAEADGWLAAAELEEPVVREIQKLAPFGFGNPSPVFLCGPFQVGRISLMGQGGQHLKIEVSDADGRRLETVAFGLGQCVEAVRNGGNAGVYLAVNPQMDSWQGRERMRVVVRDIVPAGVVPAAATVVEAATRAGAATGNGTQAAGEWAAFEALADEAVSAIAFAAAAPAPAAAIATAAAANNAAAVISSNLAAEAGAVEAEAVPVAAIFDARRRRPDGLAALRQEFAEFDPAALPGMVVVYPGITARGDSAGCLAALGPALKPKPVPPLQESAARSANSPLASGGDGPRRRLRAVLHLHPGFSLADLCARSAGAEEVWLAFGEDDAAANEALLAAVCPDRDFLVRLYRALREKNKGRDRGGAPLALGDLLADLQAGPAGTAGATGGAGTSSTATLPGAQPAARARVQVGLQVLRDLGLLEEGSLRLVPAPSGKLDLEASRTFRAVHRLVREYRNYASFVLEAPPEEVRQALVETSISTTAGRG